MNYLKVPKSSEEHIDLLKSRGLIINDSTRAKKYLENIGYFRLSGYMYHLQSSDGKHKFLDQTNFSTVIDYYQFDNKLRRIFSEYLERIEVAIRARLTDKFSMVYGFFWYNKNELYEDQTVFDMINSEISSKFDQPQELFLKRFKSNYTKESIPPSNMALEILSFGKLARLYKGLKNRSEKQCIASDFNLPSSILTSWLIYLANVRNICAHHSRLWNRRVTADRPVIPSRKKYQFSGNIPSNFNTTLYGMISMIDRLLVSINPNNTFTSKIEKIIDDFPLINSKHMGFPEDWKTQSPLVLRVS